MERWVMLRKGADFSAIGEKYHISPRIACLIRNRDVVGDRAIDDYLHGTIAHLHDGMMMKGVPQAIDILREKIEACARIRIIGDYDIDGVNATYILLEGLQRLHAQVDSDIPDRIKDGYGLNRQLIDRAYEDGVDTIITCDNGIAAWEEIEYGKRLGLTIIVTDHHEIPYDEVGEVREYRLPPADVVIDPKQLGCEYPFKALCGAAVAYKLMEALYEACGQDAADIDDLIENVAIATVGDVMDLVGENRIFVKEGLEMMSRTKNLGLKALIGATELKADSISAYHIGFVLGPCLNASGRLDTAKRALALLQAKTQKEADILAGDLKALNDSRKDMTQKAVEEAFEQIENSSLKDDHVLVVYLPDCHESLAGIVAGRVRERYYRPTFVITDGEEGAKGSGRSTESYSMYEELSKCKQLLNKFGGHPMAAGLSLEKENIEPFRKLINVNCTLTEQDMMEKVVIDMELPFRCITEEFIDELSLLEPFGKGNTKPVFAARNVKLTNVKVIGKNKNVVKATAVDETGCAVEALSFGNVDEFLHTLKQRDGCLALTYYPGINEYMGRKSMQIIITHFQ